MIELFAYLILALSIATVFVGRVEGRYVAAAASVALLLLSAYLGLLVGVVVAVAALALSLDWQMRAFGVALAFSVSATALAAYVYYSKSPPVYGLIALALVTAAVYGLLAMGRTRENVEGAMKYLVFSGVGKVFIVVGYVLAVSGWSQGLYLAVVGFMFELGIVPFHAWVVDAYALGAPKGAAALAAFSKVTALFVLLTIFPIFRSLPGGGTVGFAALVVALASMLVANVAGLTAKTLGRIMAWSSVAHMSYALAAVAVVWWLGEPKSASSLFGISISAADLAALVVVLEALTSGLAKAGVFGYLTTAFSDITPPRKSVLNVLNILSLLGLPPLLGFWPKLFLVLLALSYPALVAVFLAVWIVINSAAATPYYLRALRMMAEAPGPVADNATSSYTAMVSTVFGLTMPLIAHILL
jgi:NADH-quinone oxidoreductase subunit N